MMLDFIFTHPLFQMTAGSFLSISIILVIRNSPFQRKDYVKEDILDLRYQHAGLDATILVHYEHVLKTFLQETRSYLDADLSLDLLSEKTNIPKHHFSQLFNMHLRKNFYQMLAEYRIAYALELLNEEANLKIEYLASECGYHSRTTFNKHFKERTGVTPSKYRNNLGQLIRDGVSHP